MHNSFSQSVIKNIYDILGLVDGEEMGGKLFCYLSLAMASIRDKSIGLMESLLSISPQYRQQSAAVDNLRKWGNHTHLIISIGHVLK